MLKTNRSNQRFRSYLFVFFWTETIPFRLRFRSSFCFSSPIIRLVWNGNGPTRRCMVSGHYSLSTCLLCNAHIQKRMKGDWCVHDPLYV